MNAPPQLKVREPLPQTQWQTPPTASELDRRFPGIYDGIAVLSGAANIIMQLARPGVGHGVVESRVHSGAVFRHPVKRARTTFTYLAVAMLGNTEEKLAYRQAVNRSHAQVHSTAQSPVPYNAFDPELQLWVAACIYWGYMDVYRRFRGGFTPAQAAVFHRLAEPLGTTLQVRPGMWPADIEAFNAYWEKNLEQVQIDDTVRRYLTAIADLKFLHPALSLLFGRFNRFVTAGFLPPKFREEMRFDWGAAQQRRFERVIAALALLNRSLPRFVRQMPFNLVLADFRRRLRRGLPLV